MGEVPGTTCKSTGTVPQYRLLLLYLLKSAAIVAYTAIAFLFTSGFMGLPSSINLEHDQHMSTV